MPYQVLVLTFEMLHSRDRHARLKQHIVKGKSGVRIHRDRFSQHLIMSTYSISK